MYLVLFALLSNVFALQGRVEKIRWDDLEVVWIEDNRFPVYNIIFYFADGALSDNTRKGESNAMFSLLPSGTRRFSQKEISDNLEFFGIDQSFHITHEFTSFFVSGLVKDIIPTTKLICHLFNDASFPKKEIQKEKRRIKNYFKNMVSSHAELASRAFREISLSQTPFSYPTTGKIRDLKKMNQKGLKRKLDYFNKKVKKRIYLSGPKEVLLIKSIVNEECGWRGKESFVRKTDLKKISNKTEPLKIHLVVIPKGNQAQVRIGRVLYKEELSNPYLLALSSGFLGGGFTSRLMREVRVSRGLTYSINSFAAGQKDYGRAVISTFTKNKSVKELLEVIEKTVGSTAKGEFDPTDLERARGYLSGGHYFRYEHTHAYLNQLIHLDHVGRDYSELRNFQYNIGKVRHKDVIDNIGTIFNWFDQTIMILGPQSLAGELRKIGKVIIIPYKKFL